MPKKVAMDAASEAEFIVDPSESLGYLCRIAFRNFSRALELRTIKYGVSSGQWRFLRVLWVEDGITQRELSRRVGLREPTTVVALKGLEKNGFVHRWQSPDDKRKLHVYLTPKARQLRQTLAPFVAEVNDIATQGLSDKEAAQLKQLLRVVGRNLSTEIEGDQSLDSSV
jgi:DNA-binding MarR family transcriptional regulator